MGILFSILVGVLPTQKKGTNKTPPYLSPGVCFTDPLDPSPSLFPDAAFVLLSGFAPCCWRVQGAGVLNGESNVLELDGETVVVGDLHGQFFDLLNLLSAYGKVRGCGFG